VIVKMDHKEKVFQRSVENALKVLISSDQEEKAKKLLDSVATIIAAEKIIENANLGERSELARDVIEKLSTITLPTLLRMIREAS